MELKKPTDLYYIQDSRSYVGNCVVFLGKDRNGYVCDITKAGLYTYEEAMSQHKSRHTDIPWLKEDVENALKTFCDVQYLSKRQHEVYDELEQHKLNKAKQDKDDRARAHIAQLKDDLSYAMECLWRNVSFPLEREEVIESISKYVIKSRCYDSYYTPVIYNMTSTDIFKALMKSKKLHKCKRCELFTDELEYNMCITCIYELEEELNNDNE